MLELVPVIQSPSRHAAPEPIRWKKVMTARARIAAGYYDRPDVLEQLAAAVLDEIEHS